MSGFAIRGHCPQAWRPMASGDGLLVRVRPRLGRLDRMQVLGLCAAAIAHGNGQIDLTRRASLQIRGMQEDGVAPLLDRLVALGLVDADPARDARPGLLVAPDWREGDDTHRIATVLAARIDELPDLPPKIGFAIDAGPAPVLGDIAADFRIERGADGLLVRADGRETGTAVRPGEEVDALITLAWWFVATGGVTAGRMARHAGLLPDDGQRPLGARAPMRPGPHPLGVAVGVAFGRIAARDLAAACRTVDAVRITPWRTILFEGAAPGETPGLRTDPADPLLHADACPGAPDCAQASVATRELAARLAPLVGGSLHVSGCAKGCARSAAATVVLTGREGLFDLGLDAVAGDPPTLVAMTADQILLLFGVRLMPHAYETDGAAIYRRSFAIIRAEADLARFAADEEQVAVRMIHAAGLVPLAPLIRFSPGFVAAARGALEAGAAILCDTHMVSEGVTRARLPAANRVVCTLRDPATFALAQEIGTTRSAAALELWRPHLAGALVAIGNAPTALFHLLTMLEDPACPRPAAIVGCPVGFVGAIESKAALWAACPVPCCIVEGRMGGSAIAVAAVNAIASRAE